MMNREQFKKMFEDMQSDQYDSPLWIPEHVNHWQSAVFIDCYVSMGSVAEFWNWCLATLGYHPQCYSSSSDRQVEWWGFKTEEDAMIFLLRWKETGED